MLVTVLQLLHCVVISDVSRREDLPIRPFQAVMGEKCAEIWHRARFLVRARPVAGRRNPRFGRKRSYRGEVLSTGEFFFYFL